MGERFDLLDEDGKPLGYTKDRKLVHREGDWHRVAHVWLYVMDTKELLLQKRCSFKDSWPGKWDISSAGHIVAGDTSLNTAMKESFEELGIQFPKEAFEFLFTAKIQCTSQGGKFVNNEHADVYLVSVKARVPEDAFVLDEAEVDAIKYMPVDELEGAYRGRDESLVPANLDSEYGRLFQILKGRIASGGLTGSGIHTFFHQPRGRHAEQIQCLTFDEAYLKLVPPEHR